jgi:septum formation protein
MNRFNFNLVLGSQSPRRKQLLESLDLTFQIRISNAEEIIPKDLELEKAAEYLAKLKSDCIEIKENELLITADSVVILEGKILEKPKDNEEAAEFLKMLSGKTHKVITGVYLRSQFREKQFSETTLVKLSGINDEEIKYYTSHYNALDKAGAYGIQDWIGWVKVEHIDGSYANVMGLPTQRLYEELQYWKKS